MLSVRAERVQGIEGSASVDAHDFTSRLADVVMWLRKTHGPTLDPYRS